MSAALEMLTMRPPVPWAHHRAGGGAAAVEVAVQVGGQQPVPVLVGGLQQRLDHQPGRVVDPDVDAAERLDGRLREPLDVFDAPGVALQHEVIGAGLDLVDPRHVGARGAQRERDGAADARRGAGDDGAPSAEAEGGGPGRYRGRRRVVVRAHVRLSRRVPSSATLPARGTLRQRDPPLVSAPLAGERVALVGGQRGEVDRRLGICREHDQASRPPASPPARAARG